MHARKSIRIEAPASLVWDIVSEKYVDDLECFPSTSKMEGSFSDITWTVKLVSDSECQICLETMSKTKSGGGHPHSLDPVRSYLATLESLSGMCESIKKKVKQTC
jgi:hypothetical protein